MQNSFEYVDRIGNDLIPQLLGFASTGSRTRTWAAFKAVFKRGQLIKFQEALERMKCTLLLVQQIQDR